jgi:hypothetical protein
MRRATTQKKEDFNTKAFLNKSEGSRAGWTHVFLVNTEMSRRIA